MSAMKLILFGSPRVEQKEQPVEVSRRKSMAMLAYLAATEQPHSRDTLATLFWPEVDQRRARGNLRRALSDLNRLTRSNPATLPNARRCRITAPGISNLTSTSSFAIRMCPVPSASADRL